MALKIDRRVPTVEKCRVCVCVCVRVNTQESTQNKVTSGVRFAGGSGGSVRSTVSTASSVESAVTAASVHTDSNASFISQVRVYRLTDMPPPRPLCARHTSDK